MKKKKIKKIYCNRCRYYIPYNDDLNDFDICGYTIQTFKDQVGKLKAKMNDALDVCEECGHIKADNRKIKYARCAVKNRLYNCVDFKRKTPMNYLQAVFGSIGSVLKIFNDTFNKAMIAIFIVWAVIHTYFYIQLIKNSFDLSIDIMIIYAIISVVYFIYGSKLHRHKQ